jgi:hypothetical protein
MSIAVACPKCHKKLNLNDALMGKTIKCPVCAAVFAVKAPAGGAPAAPPVKTAPAPPKKASPPEDDKEALPRRPARADKGRDADDEEDDRPKKPAARKPREGDDEEDDRPRKPAAKKRPAADDDDDEDARRDRSRGRKPKKKGSGATVALIIGGVVLFLCAGCGGVAYWLYRAGRDVAGQISSGLEVDKAQGDKTPLAGPKPATFPPGWKEFRSDQYGFSAWLPGAPRAGDLNNASDADFTLDVPADQPLGPSSSGYWIGVVVKEEEHPLGPEFMLKTYMKLGEAHAGLGTALNERSGTFAGKPGRAWNVRTHQGGVWHFRACAAGKVVYLLGAGPEDKVPAADADKFFSSFEVRGK